jgi:hypothetical protein
MKPEGLLSSSKDSAIGLYPDSYESNLNWDTLFL